MKRLMLVLIVLGLFAVACETASAQCPNFASSSRASSSGSSSASRAGDGAGWQLSGPGSLYFSLMMQSFNQQQQATANLTQQTKKKTKTSRSRKGIDTRRKQRAAEVARREARKEQVKRDELADLPPDLAELAGVALGLSP